MTTRSAVGHSRATLNNRDGSEAVAAMGTTRIGMRASAVHFRDGVEAAS